MAQEVNPRNFNRIDKKFAAVYQEVAKIAPDAVAFKNKGKEYTNKQLARALATGDEVGEIFKTPFLLAAAFGGASIDAVLDKTLTAVKASVAKKAGMDCESLSG